LIENADEVTTNSKEDAAVSGPDDGVNVSSNSAPSYIFFGTLFIVTAMV